MREKGILIVVSGFSGSGKGTIMKELLKQYDNYALSISATTRNPRPGEEDGREYFFKTVEDFENMIAKEEALEMDQYDYLIINDDLQECVEEMHQIIQGEHRRSFRNAEFIEHMKEELKGE